MRRLLFLAIPALAIQAKMLADDFGVRLVFGHGDKLETRWDGSVSARGGQVRVVEPWRFEAPDTVEGSSWKAQIHQIRLFGSANQGIVPPSVANGVVVQLTGAGGSTEIDVTTAQGNFGVRASDVPYGRTLSLMGA